MDKEWTFTTVILIACLVLACSPSQTKQAGQFMQIAFISYRDNHNQIFVMNADGSGQTNLSNNPAWDMAPNWSADGKRIVFYRYLADRYVIVVMNADGTGQTQLTNNKAQDTFPIWSPDGRQIAFTSNRDGNEEVYLMNADGSGQTNLSNSPATDLGPTWSPDGKRLTFISNRDGNYEVYLINADGTGLLNLTQNPANDRSALGWSPDGKKIVFDSDRDGHAQIYVINADGTAQTRLTNNPSEDMEPIWSPDGKQIIYTSKPNENRDVYIINADGSGRINLTQNPADDYFPRWLPDGKQIEFLSNRDGSIYNLYRVNIDGSGLVRLTDNPGGDFFPAPIAQAQALPTQAYVTPIPTLTPVPSISQQITQQPWLNQIISSLKGNEFVSTDLKPTGMAVAPDGTLFVATSAQSDIFHINPDGSVIIAWGGFKQVAEGEKAPPGLFNEPWGIALSKDGYIFVADLWNHRIQKFTQDGQFILEWGEFGAGNDPYKFWGPRGITFDSKNRVIVTDTGNKRLVVYDQYGKYISQIGSEGKELGQFNEPVGVAVDQDDNIYVADYWNGRVQVLHIDETGVITPIKAWNVGGWDDNLLEHKGYLCLQHDRIFLTVPAYNRVEEYSTEGELLKVFDISQTGYMKAGIPTGIASDPNGNIWVSDYFDNLWLNIAP
jgi:Tol biopolymer transport system component/streptogramin lyase